MRERGIFDHGRQATLGMRMLAHLGTALEGTQGRSAVARAACLATSLAGDLAVAASHAADRRKRGLEVAINVVDLALWGLLTRRDPIHGRAAIVATIVPTLYHTGFRLGAGTDAIPSMQPPRPWRPMFDPPLTSLMRSDRRPHRFPRIDPVRIGELVGSAALDALPPIVALWAVRRVRGLRTGWGPVGWAALATVSGYALARTRDAAQWSTRETWQARTSTMIDDARTSSRVQTHLVHNITKVDPKGMLSYLERAGSTRAATALDDPASYPIRNEAGSGERGLTLVAAVDHRRVVPDTQRIRWVSRTQIQIIRDAIAAIDSSLEKQGDDAPGDDEVRVITADVQHLTLDYRGHQITADQPAPDLVVRLEPTGIAIAIASCWTIMSAHPSFGGAPRLAVAGATALQWGAAARLFRTPAADRRGDRTTSVLLAASTIILDCGIALRSRSTGCGGECEGEAGQNELCPVTSATQPLMLLVGGSWSDLRRERGALLALGLGAWTLGYVRACPPALHTFIQELAFLVMPAVASVGINRKTRNEAQILDAALRHHLETTVEDAARSEARREVDRFLNELSIVVDELPRLHPGLDDDEVADIVHDFELEYSRVAALDPLTIIDR